MQKMEKTLLTMQARNFLPLTHKLEPSEIQRVEQLMTVPYDKLSSQDADLRAVLGSQRTKETLSCVAWYAKQAQKAALEGKEPEFWLSLWLSGVNFLHPPKESPTTDLQPTETPD